MNTAAHPVATGTPAASTSTSTSTNGRDNTRNRDADGMAVASFLLGLPGLLVLNLVLGPAAVVLALVALSRGTGRRGRALLGLALGVADLAIFFALMVANHGVIWDFS